MNIEQEIEDLKTQLALLKAKKNVIEQQRTILSAVVEDSRSLLGKVETVIETLGGVYLDDIR